MLHGANFDKMLEVDPESCAQAFKGSSSVNHAPPMAEDKASTQGPGALAGLKVIDLTRVLGGPYCTMVLSDHGAEVIKLEPPQGDETREWGPPFDDAGDASYFIGINRNKKSIGLDLSKPAGRQVLLRLLQDADVLVENFKPGSMSQNCPLPDFSRSCDRRPLYLADNAPPPYYEMADITDCYTVERESVVYRLTRRPGACA